MMYRYFSVFVLLVLFGCAKSNPQIVKIPSFKNVVFLGHKGAGNFGVYGSEFHENTMNSAMFSLQKVDGCEVDVQITKDTLLVLHHDVYTKVDSINIFDLTFDSLRTVYNNRKDPVTLQALAEKIHGKGLTKKYLSLDCKFLYNPKVIHTFSSSEKFRKSLVKRLNEIKKLIAPNKLLLEVPGKDKFMFFQEHGFTSFWLRGDSSDMPLSLNHGHSESLEKNNQYWVLNDFENFLGKKVVDSCFVQSDNIPLMAFLKLKRTEEFSISKKLNKIYDFNQQFISTLLKEHYGLIEVKHNFDEEDGVVLVVTENTDASNRFYKTVRLDKSRNFIFIDSSYFSDVSTPSNVYFWNPENKNLGDREIEISLYR
ncbi:glycerophosphodiester phosphodiesterase family protein [Lishizhenia sp.]|uniref:glycerophosphodiester phosphodiesterase family protein n=1 Tax=Lishizhenia sp. TaxID=2497594 RepID=UPI00299DFA69|nr:glycerophosphodiester phosphodiesterase family protein [Lishizhenia sp.]MDX1445348.1 glycerophosphodiester phosphodiesterase family protein [Lishizhenia sp.]